VSSLRSHGEEKYVKTITDEYTTISKIMIHVAYIMLGKVVR